MFLYFVKISPRLTKFSISGPFPVHEILKILFSVFVHSNAMIASKDAEFNFRGSPKGIFKVKGLTLISQQVFWKSFTANWKSFTANQKSFTANSISNKDYSIYSQVEHMQDIRQGGTILKVSSESNVFPLIALETTHLVQQFQK